MQPPASRSADPRPAGAPPGDDPRTVHDALALYKSILSSALDPIVVIDAAGIIRAASESVRRVFLWTPEELVGRNIAVLMPEPVLPSPKFHS